MKSELLQNKDMKTSASEFNYSPMKYYLALQQQQKKTEQMNNEEINSMYRTESTMLET